MTIVYRRKDLFLVIIPLLFFIDAFGLCADLLNWKSLYWVHLLGMPSHELAHWLFSNQYLKTSLTLPKLLTQEKLQKLERDAQPEHNLARWSLEKSEDELSKHKVTRTSNDIIDIF